MNGYNDDLREIELDDKVANQMLNNIFRACNVTPNAIPLERLKSWGNYQRTDFLLCKSLCIVLLTLLVLVPFFFIPSSLKMPNIPKGADRATLELSVDSILPVMNIEAILNGNELEVVPVKYNCYSTEITQNGELDVSITLVNGRSTQFDLKIDSLELDKDIPVITDSSLEGNELTVYVADADSGVDYKNAYAIDEGGKKILPITYDETSGTIVFPYKHDNMNLFIPDKKGNVLQAVVSSSGSAK